MFDRKNIPHCRNKMDIFVTVCFNFCLCVGGIGGDIYGDENGGYE